MPDESLSIMDRNFINYGVLYRLAHDDEGNPRPRHWLVRAKANLKWKTLETLGPGDELVELTISSLFPTRPSSPDSESTRGGSGLDPSRATTPRGIAGRMAKVARAGWVVASHRFRRSTPLSILVGCRASKCRASELSPTYP